MRFDASPRCNCISLANHLKNKEIGNLSVKAMPILPTLSFTRSLFEVHFIYDRELVVQKKHYIFIAVFTVTDWVKPVQVAEPTLLTAM